MIGVSFDPAQDPSQNGRPSGPNQSTAPRGVQEAIKILSLRLPRVVGANAVSPQSLLSAPGGSGMVDSVVNQVIAKYFPQASPETQASMIPEVGQQQPGVSGKMPVSPPVRLPTAKQTPDLPDIRRPRVKVDEPGAPPQQWPSPSFQGNPYESITFAAPAYQPPPPVFQPPLPNDPFPMI